ncbi:reverse transcriptase domain-containing protein [Trichonephila clavipes]|nr:reverse transcriptase domain-containing protein [Trichonephila clavipes]
MTGYARDFTGRECTEMSFAEVDEIAKFLLEEIVLRHGAPRVIITDRGAVFRSRLVSSRRLVSQSRRITTASRVHTLRAQDKDRRRYDSKHQMVSYAPGDLVLRRLSAVTYEVQDFDPASRKRKLREVVHVLRMKPYHDPAEQIETEDIPPKESYKGPITRSRIKTLEQMTAGRCLFRGEQCHTHNFLQVPIAELAERWTEFLRSRPFTTERGLRQGDLLACLLFNLVLEKYIRDSGLDRSGTLWNRSLQLLAYADDIDIIGRSEKAMKEAFQALEISATNMGLTINAVKTKVHGNTALFSVQRTSSYTQVIRSNRLRWLGHIWRSPENNQTRAYTLKNLMGSRTRGRPPTRWIDDVENDLKTLNTKNWQRVAAYRWNWRKRAVEAAKTCNRLLRL